MAHHVWEKSDKWAEASDQEVVGQAGRQLVLVEVEEGEHRRR